MKKSMFILILCFLFLTSCVGETSDTVSREEYESVVSEIDALKAQIESMEKDKEESIELQSESQEPKHEEQISYEKELLGEFLFEWDENNKISLSFYKEGDEYFANGYGIYEQDNLSLLQENYYWMCTYTSFFMKEVEINYTVGEDEYAFLVSDGEIIAETTPMDEIKVVPEKYRDKRLEYEDQIMDFYDSTIWNH